MNICNDLYPLVFSYLYYTEAILLKKCCNILSKKEQQMEKYCQHIQPHGKIEIKGIYPEIYTHKEGNYREGKEEGEHKYWNKDKLYMKVNYKNGKKHGIYEYWFNNNQLSTKYNYKNGKQDGIQYLWHYDGDLSNEYIFIEGKIKREIKYNNEYIFFEINYNINNMQKQESKGWYKNGQLNYIYNYKNEKEEGIQKQWYDNGQLYFEFNYKEGKEEGIQKQWYDNGQLKYEHNYKNGIQKGIQKQWYENGQLWYKENYKNGKKECQQYWHSDKKLKYRIT